MSSMFILNLSSNELSGVLPSCLENSSIKALILRNNKLTGNVSSGICNLNYLYFLYLSNYNKLSGMLPQLISLEHLNIASNSFHGILSQTYTNGSCTLRMFDVSYNQLQGKLPRSLANCAALEFLVLSNNTNNKFDDVFPFWLGTLPELKFLAMRHNGFYGVIGQPNRNLHFPELRILDLSYNSFSGYAIRGISFTHERSSYDYYLLCSITITNPLIQEDLVAIHISSNRFEGNIPEFIVKLQGLRLLNISNNSFTGHIPSLFGKRGPWINCTDIVPT